MLWHHKTTETNGWNLVWAGFAQGKWEVLNLYHCLIRCFQIAENVEEKRTVIHYVSRHSIGQLEDLSFASRSMSLVHETNSKMIIGPSSVAFCHPTNLCYSPPRFLDCQSTLPKKCRQIYPPPPRNGYLRATPPCHHYVQEVWRLPYTKCWVRHLVLKWVGSSMSEKQALNCRQIYPSPQGSGCFGAITPCPRYVQVQSNYLYWTAPYIQ